MHKRPSIKERLTARTDHLLGRARHRYNALLFRSLIPENPPPTAKQWAIFAYFTAGGAEAALTVMLARHLMKRGVHCKFLTTGVGFDHQIVADDLLSGAVARVSQMECRLLKRGSERIEWSIDYDNATFVADGLDVSELIYTTVVRHVPIERRRMADPDLRPVVDKAVATADAIFRVAKRLECAASAGKRVTYICHEGLALPNAGIAAYFEGARSGMINIYYCGSSYNQYFSFHGDHRRSVSPYITLTKATTVRETTSQFCMSHEEFADWFGRQDQAQLDEALEAMHRLTAQPPTAAMKDRTDYPEYDEKIAEYRRQGKPVYVLFSHLTAEFLPFEGSLIFKDLYDWIEKTIDIFRNIDGLLLLKPHIGEHVWKAKYGDPKRHYKLKDFAATLECPDNIVVLPPDYYTTYDITRLADAALIWRSTAFLELTIHGMPALFSAGKSYFFRPLQLSSPETLADYEAQLRALPGNPPSPELSRRAAALLYYAHHDRIERLDMLNILPDGNLLVNPWRFLTTKLFDRHGMPICGDAIVGGTEMYQSKSF
jgi:hypothetical protein